MQIRIADIKDEGLSLDLLEEIADFPVLQELQKKGEVRFSQPLEVHLRAVLIGGMVEVDGRVQTLVEMSCSRCLKPAPVSIGSAFEVTYTRELPEIHEEDGAGEVEVSAEEMGLILFSGDEIDLRETVQEQVVLALPFHPLCDSNCRGLCPNCGADLNETTCECGSQNFNIKFAALKNLKIDK